MANFSLEDVKALRERLGTTTLDPAAAADAAASATSTAEDDVAELGALLG